MELLTLLLKVATICQLCFLWYVFRFAFQEDKATDDEVVFVPVSVIVCFRNEAARLTKYLGLIGSQDYPEFEIIAVDDHSTDESAEVVSRLAEVHPHIRLVKPLKPTRLGKKDALTYGIQCAQYDTLLLTDADCAPATDQWIRLMTMPLARDVNTEVVLGFSPYRVSDASCNDFQRFETTYTAFQYLGMAKTSFPYMGVGRNLAYRKSFFQRAGGLERHSHIPGGDDDLLLSHYALEERTAVVTDKAAWTISDAAESWQDYLSRKMRHVGVGIHYPVMPKILIGLLALSHVLHYGLVIVLCILQVNMALVCIFFFMRWVSVVFVYNRYAEQKNAYPVSQASKLLYYDFLLCFYYGLTAWSLFKSGQAKGGWKA